MGSKEKGAKRGGRGRERTRVFMTGPLQDSAMRRLRRVYDVDAYEGRLPMSRRGLLSGLRDAEGLICFPFDSVDAAALDAAPRLRAISTYSVGFDHIDIKRARERGIVVGYTPEVLTEATADISVALMLDLMRRVSEGDRLIRGGGWRGMFGATDYVGVDLRGKTLGILGLGRIGEAVARRAAAFGMNVAYHNRHRLPARMERGLGARYVGFGRLLSGSDVISVHVPYSGATHHLFDSGVFARMKRTAYLINTSRGKVVCEPDLVRALRTGVIAGAGLDVFESEPVRRSNPLVRLPNVVLAPHIGSSTAETRSEMADLTLRNLDLGLRGQRPVHSVWR